MKHPGLLIVVDFFFDEFLIEVTRRTFSDIMFHWNAGLACERQSPKDVGSHVVIAVAVFPPTPATVGVLEVVQTIETLARDLIEFLEVTLTFRMRGQGYVGFNSAKHSLHRVLRFHAETPQRLCGDRRGQETAHCLFGAAVRVIDEIRQRVEHGSGHARCYLY